MILVVGVGGIGCELVKNLILCGHKKIDLIDLDTIELTNLSRQFLFQSKHIGLPKATIAAEVLTKIYSTATDPLKIEPFVGNIFDGIKFPPSFFSKYSIVYGALDNVEARRMLNKICLTLNIPLIETGTAGYLGQMSIIYPGITECFDCNEHPVPTVYPVCTIKNTPSSMIHCAVWAKEYLFNSIFNQGSQNQYKEKDGGSSFFTDFVYSYNQNHASPVDLAVRIFIRDIENSLKMDELWESRKKPTPLNIEILTDNHKCIDSPFDEHYVYSPEQ